jgi:hypothetical protein
MKRLLHLTQGALLLSASLFTHQAQAALSYTQDGCSVRVSTTLTQNNPNTGRPLPYVWYISWTRPDGSSEGESYTTDGPSVTILTSGRNISSINASVRLQSGYPTPYTGFDEYATFSITPNTTSSTVSSLSPNFNPADKPNPGTIARNINNSVIYANNDGWLKIAQPGNGTWYNWYLTSGWDGSEQCHPQGSVAVNDYDQVFYVGKDRMIHQYYYDNGWHHTLLTHTWNGNEAAALGPDAIAINKDHNVYYAGRDGWMHMYTYNQSTGQWDHYTVGNRTDDERAAADIGISRGYGIVAVDYNTNNVYFRGFKDQRLHQYYYTGNFTWGHAYMVQDWSNSEQTSEVVKGKIVTSGSGVYFIGADANFAPKYGDHIRGYNWASDKNGNYGWRIMLPIVAPLSQTASSRYMTTADESNLLVGPNDQLYFSGKFQTLANGGNGANYPYARLQTVFVSNGAAHLDNVSNRWLFSPYNEPTPRPTNNIDYQMSVGFNGLFMDSSDPHSPTSDLPSGSHIMQGARMLLADNNAGLFYTGEDGFLRYYHRDNCAASTGFQLRTTAYLKPGTSGPPPANQASQADAESASVFPNPAMNAAIIACHYESAAAGKVQIANSLGAVVYQKSLSWQVGSNQTELDVSALAAGIYQITLTASDQPARHLRLVIAK